MVRENMIGTSVRLPRELLERLEALASNSRWTKGEIHRQALEFYLGVLESGHFLAPWYPAGKVPQVAIEEMEGGEPIPQFEPGPDILALMRKIEPGADRGTLVTFRELRKASNMKKEEFDALIWALSSRGLLSLHRHDFATNLTVAERIELVASPEGDYFIGCAVRQN